MIYTCLLFTWNFVLECAALLYPIKLNIARPTYEDIYFFKAGYEHRRSISSSYKKKQQQKVNSYKLYSIVTHCVTQQYKNVFPYVFFYIII